jgi:hypothetical protein
MLGSAVHIHRDAYKELYYCNLLAGWESMEGGENNQTESVAQPDFAFVVCEWSDFFYKRKNRETTREVMLLAQLLSPTFSAPAQRIHISSSNCW